MDVLMGECTGLWRRTLLIDADGARHAEPGVLWLQGLTAYVDSRGFAGRLHQSGNVFEWQRDVDLEPPGPFPDAGSMMWDGDVLVETGVHAEYAEHWVRDAGSLGPCSAAFLRGPDGADGLLLRVGDQFGWAGGGAVVIGRLDGHEWEALGVTMSDNEIHANGARWAIERSEGDVQT
ncbi:hypothetical protein TUM20985_38090 [Mycobacterium antarcticum]|nr:hypothetical protein TUM20985_38090 [Mycolicibacterium sp. TUM20985]GLP83184.1 hypothetical protein TUM20984_46040 [Mycolicibacterium sp. TUM20984]